MACAEAWLDKMPEQQINAVITKSLAVIFSSFRKRTFRRVLTGPGNLLLSQLSFEARPRPMPFAYFAGCFAIMSLAILL